MNQDAVKHAQMHLEDAEDRLEKLRLCEQIRHSQIVREQITDVRGCVVAAQRYLAIIFEEKA